MKDELDREVAEQPLPDDWIETLLAHLVCAESVVAPSMECVMSNNASAAPYLAARDAGNSLLKFSPMKPERIYTVDVVDSDRIYALDGGLLAAPMQDILAERAEIAVLKPDCVEWIGYRKLSRTPRGVYIAGTGRPSLYEVHGRIITSTGQEEYYQRVAAISAKGTPLPVCFVGSKGTASRNDSEVAVLAASIIEDAHRPNAILATVAEYAKLCFPVPFGAHIELFSLRDAPLTPSGRRKAILHWVSRHVRRKKAVVAPVSAHWRGVKELVMDGFKITLDATHTEPTPAPVP